MYRRAWGISVKKDDDAYLWARWLAPVYSVTCANVKAALRVQASWLAGRPGCVARLPLWGLFFSALALQQEVPRCRVDSRCLPCRCCCCCRATAA